MRTSRTRSEMGAKVQALFCKIESLEETHAWVSFFWRRLILTSAETLSHNCLVATQEGKNTKPYLGVAGATGSGSGGGQD